MKDALKATSIAAGALGVILLGVAAEVVVLEAISNGRSDRDSMVGWRQVEVEDVRNEVEIIRQRIGTLRGEAYNIAMACRRKYLNSDSADCKVIEDFIAEAIRDTLDSILSPTRKV